LTKAPRNVAARGHRREAILSIAREVFAEEGYSSASMSHIASRLGGSKGTLYNYFKSKEELFHAHVEDRCNCHVRAAFGQSLEGDDPVLVLAQLGERMLELWSSEEAVAFYSVIVSEARRDPSVGHAFYENGPRLGIRRVADFLEGARAAGRIAAEDCVQAAEDFLSLLHGGLHWRRVLNVVPPPNPEQIRAEALRVARTFMRAYAPSAVDRSG
jgi:AcrR family transcriptional regulator